MLKTDQKKRLRSRLRNSSLPFFWVQYLTIAGYNYFSKQERRFVSEKLSGDVKSISRIAFFIIGRDIRRAGSNPSQAVPAALSGTAAAPIPLAIAQPDQIEILSDLNGDNDTDDPDEDITYIYVDSNGDGVKDQVRRGPDCARRKRSVIDNVTNFALSYIYGIGRRSRLLQIRLLL